MNDSNIDFILRYLSISLTAILPVFTQAKVYRQDPAILACESAIVYTVYFPAVSGGYLEQAPVKRRFGGHSERYHCTK